MPSHGAPGRKPVTVIVARVNAAILRDRAASPPCRLMMIMMIATCLKNEAPRIHSHILYSDSKKFRTSRADYVTCDQGVSCNYLCSYALKLNYCFWLAIGGIWPPTWTPETRLGL